MTADDRTDPRSSAPTPFARRTPYELVFQEGEFESRLFPRIEREAGEQGIESLNPVRFAFLSTGGEILRELTPEEAPPDAIEQYRALLFQAFNFWRHDRRLYVLERPLCRYLVEATPTLEGWAFATPAPAGYVQLPANLFWGSVAPDTPPEPLDGFFFAASEEEDALGEPFQRLDVLLVLGIRRSRAGFSVIPLETEFGPRILQSVLQEGRPGGDFTSVLPGGEMSGLYSILTSGEALKLVARTLWYIDTATDALVQIAAAEPRGSESDPPPTDLAFTLARLASDNGETAPSHEG